MVGRHAAADSIVGKVMYDHMKKNKRQDRRLHRLFRLLRRSLVQRSEEPGLPMGITIAGEERFARPDTSVQVRC